jgi:hypothetical protein
MEFGMDQNQCKQHCSYRNSVSNMLPRAGFIALLVALVAGGAQAEFQPGDFEKILLPIAGTGATPGGYGSLWMNDFWVFNKSSAAAIFADTTNCDLRFGGAACELTWDVPSNSQSRGDFAVLPGDPPGLLLYLNKANSAATMFNLRVQDISRQAETWGTELPVVREAQFRTDRIELLNIPIDSRFRQTLRIYDPDAHERVTFRVTFFDTTAVARGEERSGGTLIADIVVDAQAGKTYRPNFPRVPSVAQLSTFRQLLPQFTATERVRVEVQPVTEGVRFWAFVSVTNNDTQHVTTVTP